MKYYILSALILLLGDVICRAIKRKTDRDITKWAREMNEATFGKRE